MNEELRALADQIQELAKVNADVRENLEMSVKASLAASKSARQAHAFMQASVTYLRDMGILSKEDVDRIAERAEEILSHGNPVPEPAKQPN